MSDDLFDELAAADRAGADRVFERYARWIADNWAHWARVPPELREQLTADRVAKEQRAMLVIRLRSRRLTVSGSVRGVTDLAVAETHSADARVGGVWSVKIDLFNEIQNPRPWSEGHEQRRFRLAIEHATLADRLGYGCWWQVEHHGAGEFSLSSAPELLLAAISQHTSRIRLGHAAVLAPGRFNHPVRVAERAATLDHLSGGRVELGMTRSTIPEWRLFNVEPDDARAQTRQAFEMVPRMWTSDRFSHHSADYRIDDVSIVPKPVQRPHPPLWQAAASPSSFEDAGRRGVGVLGTTMWESLERVGRMIQLYRAAAEACTDPVGAFVNNQVAYFTFVHCAETDEEAMRNGAAAAAAWYTVTALTFFEAATEFAATMRRHQDLLATPGGGGLTGEFLRGEADNAPTEAQLLIGRVLQGEKVPEDELFAVLSAQQSLIVGSPDTCRKKLQAYADLGIDRLMCLQQIGNIPDDKVTESIHLIGDLIPDFDKEWPGRS